MSASGLRLPPSARQVQHSGGPGRLSDAPGPPLPVDATCCGCPWRYSSTQDGLVLKMAGEHRTTNGRGHTIVVRSVTKPLRLIGR